MPELTVKERILDVLREEPDGLSRSELYRRAQCNPGTFRRNLQQLLDRGEITLTLEARKYGETAVHRLADPAAAQRARGQLGIEDADGPGYDTTAT